MTEPNPFIHTLQQEIDDLRGQAGLLPPGRKRNAVLARADALEVTMKAFLRLNRRDYSRRNATRGSAVR